MDRLASARRDLGGGPTNHSMRGHWVWRDLRAEQVSEHARYRDVGDGHPECDGATDGVGEQTRLSVQIESWDVRYKAKPESIHAPGPLALRTAPASLDASNALWVHNIPLSIEIVEQAILCFFRRSEEVRPPAREPSLIEVQMVGMRRMDFREHNPKTMPTN